MNQEESNLMVPEGWKASSSYAEPGADTGKQEKNLEKVEPGPQSGEDDYHSKYVDPEGPYGGVAENRGTDPNAMGVITDMCKDKTEMSTETSYGGKGGEEQERPEGDLPMVPHDWGLQAPRYPARHKGVASSY
jgi:hypothetical protein